MLGRVTAWNDDDGYGVIDVPELGAVWAHFSAIESDPGEFRRLRVGEQVALEVESRPLDSSSDAPGFAWVAVAVTQVAPPA